MLMRSVRRLFPPLQRAARKFGLHIDYFGRARDSDTELYSPLYEPWRSPEWQTALRAKDTRSLVSLDRKYVLHQLLLQSITGCNGAVAECGVYKGGTAYLFATILEGKGRSLYLFDTFDGMPETRARLDKHVAGDFADTNLTDVKVYMSPFDFVRLERGFIPNSLQVVASETFAFVHIDLDIYDAVAAASEFFYRRVQRGGFIVYDDYGFPSCPGARTAVDEFFADKREVPLVLRTGQCVICKI